MRMAGLPRRHQNSVPIWVEVTTVKQCRAISRRERFETWPATTRDFAPRLRLASDRRVRRAIREMRIAKCGLRIDREANSKSDIRNSKSL